MPPRKKKKTKGKARKAGAVVVPDGAGGAAAPSLVEILPAALLVDVATFLPAMDLARLQCVCRLFIGPAPGTGVGDGAAAAARGGGVVAAASAAAALATHGRPLPPLLPGEAPTLALRFVEATAAARQRAVPIACRNHTLVATASGRLLTFGEGEQSALGHGYSPTLRDLKVPKVVKALAGVRVVAVAAGEWHSLAVTDEGRLLSWGRDGWGVLGNGGNGGTFQSTPVPVAALAHERVASVAAGGHWSMALTADGRVFTWGGNFGGTLGHGVRGECRLPKLVEALVGQPIAQIAAGDHHALALSAEGKVSSWGSAVWGCPGHGVKTDQLLPKEVEALAATRVVHVSASSAVSMSVAADGRLFTWGSADAGALGHADLSDRLTPTVVEALAGTQVLLAFAGYMQAMAVAADGRLFTWGRGKWGTLGHGDEENQRMPKVVEALASQRVVRAASFTASLAVTASGRVFAWGQGKNGRLGLGGDLNDRTTPTVVAALTGMRIG